MLTSVKRSTRLKDKKILIVAAVAVAAIISVTALQYSGVSFCGDVTENALWLDIVSRIIITLAAAALACLAGYGKIFTPEKKGVLASVLWCLPCLAVAVVNFPFSALASGSAQVTRPDLIGLFALKCLFIGLTEEIIFRGIILCLVADVLKGKRNGTILTVIITAAVFAVYHLFNLIGGADPGATALQICYSFLTGVMFASVFLKTRNVWLCVFLHALFDFGGLLITDIGAGAVHDGIFWALTATAGIICFVHVLYFLLRRNANDGEESNGGDNPSA